MFQKSGKKKPIKGRAWLQRKRARADPNQRRHDIRPLGGGGMEKEHLEKC